VDEIESEDFRLIKVEYGVEKHRRTNTKCCVCKESMWVRDSGTVNWLIGTKVMDSRAYVGGLPDYLTQSNVLLEIHIPCQEELKKRLDDGLFIDNPNV